MTYAYIRVSTHDQNEDRQLMALSAFEIPARNLFLDKQSGKDFNRPAYQRLMKKLKPVDLLIVKSIDRLGRNYNGASLPKKNRPTFGSWTCPCWTPASTAT